MVVVLLLIFCAIQSVMCLTIKTEAPELVPESTKPTLATEPTTTRTSLPDVQKF